MEARRETRRYDVALSFAGEDRAYVEAVADHLREHDVAVFYDKYERVELWGKDLYQHLDEVYRLQAHLCVIFVSSNYSRALWATHENKSAQARAFSEQSEYILPARFDDTELPGLRPTVAYLDLRELEPVEVADAIVEKLAARPLRQVLASQPTFLHAKLGARTKQERRAIDHLARVLFRRLKRASVEERSLLWHALTESCIAEAPYVHVGLDWVTRSAGMARDDVLASLGALRALGLHTRLRKFGLGAHPDEIGAEEDDLLLEWWIASERGELATLVARWMATAGPLCEDHSLRAFTALDLSYLAQRPSDRCLWGRLEST